MLTANRGRWVAGALVVGLVALLASSAGAQMTRGPRDFLDRDQYGNRYRSNVFDQDRYPGNGYASDDGRSPRPRRAIDDELQNRPAGRPTPRMASRYRRPPNDGLIRNDYAGAPVYRHYYGGVDRYDSPGYLDDAGRASARANGYSRRGVEEFSDSYGRGVRTNDVYPLERNVDPERYRGRDLNGSMSSDNEDTSGARDVEDFVRSELSLRPGANLRVSSTGTYTFKNYLDQGNQVHARYRQPAHKRWEYGRGP